jgi:hypothetical protein
MRHDRPPYILGMEPLLPVALRDALSGLHAAAFVRDDLYRLIVVSPGRPTERIPGRHPILPEDPAGVDLAVREIERLLGAWTPPHHPPAAIHLGWAGAAVVLGAPGQSPEGLHLPGAAAPKRRRGEDALERWLIAHARRIPSGMPTTLDGRSAHARLAAAAAGLDLPGPAGFPGVQAVARGGLAIAFTWSEDGTAEPRAWVPA